MIISTDTFGAAADEARSCAEDAARLKGEDLGVCEAVGQEAYDRTARSIIAEHLESEVVWWCWGGQESERETNMESERMSEGRARARVVALLG